MKNLILLTVILVTFTLHAQPNSIKWGHGGKIDGMDLKGCFPVNENIVCCYTQKNMLLYNMLDQKNDISGDIPFPTLTGFPDYKKQHPVKLFPMSGKIWLVSALAMDKRDSKLFLSSINPRTMKNNNDVREIGSVAGWIFNNEVLFKLTTYIPPDSSGVLISVVPQAYESKTIWVGKDSPWQFWFINKKGEVAWQWNMPLEEFDQSLELFDFISDKNNNLVLFMSRKDKELKDWHPDKYTYALCTYDAKEKKYHRTDLPNENHYFTKPQLKLSSGGKIVLARVSYEANEVSKKGKPENYKNAGIVMSWYDPILRKLTSNPISMLSQELVTKTVSVEDYSNLVLMYLQELQDGKWAYAVENQYLKYNETYTSWRGNIIAGKLDAEGKVLTSALLTKLQKEYGSVPKSISAFCYSNNSGTYFIYFDLSKNYNLPPSSPDVKTMDAYEDIVVSLLKDNAFTKTGKLNKVNEYQFAPNYVWLIGPNKFLLTSVKYSAFSKMIMIGTMTIGE